MKKIFCFSLLILLAAISAHVPATAAGKKSYKLRDFAGDWVMNTSSVGGIGLNPGPGMASNVQRHLTLDADGHATDSDGSYTFYTADGKLVHYNDDQGKDPFNLILEDPVSGAGKLIYIDTNTYKSTQVYKFIATRNKSGKVNKLYLLLVDTSGVNIVVNGVAERQAR